LTKFRYRTPYRFYTLAKAGFALAYFWYMLDFFRIHEALFNGMSPLLDGVSGMAFTGVEGWDALLRVVAVAVSGRAMVWIFFLASPLVMGLFIWGRHRWLQVAVGSWVSVSMISMSALAGIFCTTADIWVHYVFLTYTLTAVLSPGDSWGKSEPGLDLALWRANPTLESTYAWIIVGLQFTVYFYAGVNKLVFGWVPWTTGAALQNLAFDSSMHEFARGVAVPLWIALPLCYVTLLQRLVVPFGFYVRRFRFWSVLILGTMHLGYAILMYVNLFPLIGISCLLMILPPSDPEAVSQAAGRPVPKKAPPAAAGGGLRTWTITCLVLWLVLEPIRIMNSGDFLAWEGKFMVVPVWRMFADGGVTSGGKWQIVLQTNAGEVDATKLPLDLLSHSWRDRFYIDYIYHCLISGETGPGSLPDLLLHTTETLYRNRQLEAGADPTILKSGFNIYSRNQ
jgi:hypothetical protein